MHELLSAGLRIARQVPIPVAYRGIRMECGYRADLIVEEELLIEVKSVDRVMPVHRAQVLTYLKLAGLHQGLIVNFNQTLVTAGIVSLLR